MKLLRLLAGYSLYDHKTNDYISRELQITGILDKINEYRRNWFQHLQRMPQNRIPWKSYCYKAQGRRTIGRPKKVTTAVSNRAVVTLDTERIRGSNPWCLWWWWWWWCIMFVKKFQLVRIICSKSLTEQQYVITHIIRHADILRTKRPLG
jgi:hypothetical protein